MNQNLAPTFFLSGPYTAQKTALNFDGLTYTLAGSTFTVSQQTQNNATAYLYLTNIQPDTISSIIIGNYIVGPNIPSGSKIIDIIGSVSTTALCRMSQAQPIGLTNATGYNVATGSRVNYGQVVASAPSFTTDSNQGQLDFYTRTAGNPFPTMTLVNGNVGIGYGKTVPLQALDISGSAIVSGNLAIGSGKTFARPGLALDVSGTMTILNGNLAVGKTLAGPTLALDVSGTMSIINGNLAVGITNQLAGPGFALDISGNTNMSGDSVLNGMVEKYSNGTVLSNAITIVYQNQNQPNIVAIAPSSDANIALTITGLPTTRGTAIYDFTFIITTTSFKRYINSLTVNGTPITMKALNGISNIVVSASATKLIQSISIQMSDASIIDAYTNVANYF